MENLVSSLVPLVKILVAASPTAQATAVAIVAIVAAVVIVVTVVSATVALVSMFRGGADPN